MLQLLHSGFPFSCLFETSWLTWSVFGLSCTGKLRAGEIRGKSFENQVVIELAWQLPSRKDLLPSKPLASGINGCCRMRQGLDGEWTEQCPAGRKILLSWKLWWGDCEYPWGSHGLLFPSWMSLHARQGLEGLAHGLPRTELDTGLGTALLFIHDCPYQQYRLKKWSFLLT